jgi:4-phospho-D-threonate 3-dehydrogenase / 4-phospho-D-erythronate 3-dehydrogenase
MTNTLPLIGVTLGDPSGIGPEVALKAALELKSQQQSFHVFLAGSYWVAETTIKRLNLPTRIDVISGPEETFNVGSALALLDIQGIATQNIEFGKANSACADTATAGVVELVKLALDRRIAALACAPVSKQALLMSNTKDVGHTELIARLCGINNYGMFFKSPRLSVMTVTGHIPLRDVEPQITMSTILRKLRLAANTFYELYDRVPRIAVCSVDPHCGENGFLGRTDTDVVRHAVMSALEEGLLVDGPQSADAVFRPYIIKRYDLILSMYHDQAKVGIAALNSDNFVAYLAGIPIVRTTTTHGAAFDIAGQGIANPLNMRRTIKAAAEIYRRRIASAPKFSTAWSCPVAEVG